MLTADIARRPACVFVDFENVFYSLKNEGDGINNDDATDQALELLSNLREYLRTSAACEVAIGRSYADFDRLGSEAQGQLQLLGFEPRYMMATPHKNSSDILLSIDAIDMLHLRPEIELFVLVAGDRDYLPVVRRLQERLKRVMVVGFPRHTSGDLRGVVGQENFISAETLLPAPEPAPVAVAPPASPLAAPAGAPTATPLTPAGASPATPLAPGGARTAADRLPELPADAEDSTICMRALIEKSQRFGSEVWLGPFLRDLNEHLPYLDNRGRKRVISTLVERGAIKIETKKGELHPYSFVTINWNDPWVQKLNTRA